MKKKKRVAEIVYSECGDGRWFKHEYHPQCDETAAIFKDCQGTMGHKGEHWAYGSFGQYYWSDNENDPSSRRSTRGVAGISPPGTKDYISPLNKHKDLYMNFYTDSEVTDATKIAELERDECEKGAVINRLCSDDEIKWLRDNGRLDGLGLDGDDEV